MTYAFMNRPSAHSSDPMAGDPLHAPLIDTRRREGGLERDLPGGPSDAFLKYACPDPANVMTLRTATVKPVRIAKDDGSNPTKAPDLSVAKRIFKRCCVNLNVEPVQTLNRTAFQTLDSFGDDHDGLSLEQERLATALLEKGRITVATIRNWKIGPNINTTTHGGALTYGYGSDFPTVIVVDSAVPQVIAHEVGHGLGSGRDNAAGTIMQATSSPASPNPEHVDAAVCREVRSGPVVSSPGGVCCQEIV